MLWPAVACVGLLCAAGGRRRARRRDWDCTSDPAPTPAPRQGQNCPPMPWMGDEINSHMLAQWAAGEREVVGLAIGALRDIYPESPDGQALRWPTHTGDCAEKRVLESRVILRAERLVAEARDIEADQLWFSGGGY